MSTVSQTRMGFAARWSLPFLREISGLRTNGEFFACSSGQSYAEHQSPKGSWLPFASGSLEAPGGERPQPTPDHTGDLHVRCPNLDIDAEQWLFIASYNFVDVFFFIESLFSWCCPTWPSSSNAASIPVQAVFDPFYMTARVKSTLIAVSIASVAVQRTLRSASRL